MRLGRIISVLMLLEVLSSLETSMVVTALPTIMRQFNNMQRAGWLMAGFSLVQAGSVAILSRLGDLFGRRLLWWSSLAYVCWDH
jgi:MFS family permease